MASGVGVPDAPSRMFIPETNTAAAAAAANPLLPTPAIPASPPIFVSILGTGERMAPGAGVDWVGGWPGVEGGMG